jgi:CubicO group peptidase (beta-lactamase class C family)
LTAGRVVPEASRVADERLERIRDGVAAQMAETGTPGVSIGVLSEGDVQTAALGVTNLEHPLAATRDTLFQIGSITKTFTGTAALRLVERGALDLDEPVRRYLPELHLADEDVAARVTMRHLLTHTGGWVGDFFDDLGSGDDALGRMVSVMAELPQTTPLGEVWSYNNSGFYLAGRLLETIAGAPYEALLRELVLEPLGLERSFFFADEVITHRVAAGHFEDEDGETVVARPWAIGRAAHPAGGLVSTVGDVLRYARFHLGEREVGEAGVLTRESLELMRTPQVRLGEDEAVGITWMLREVDGRRLVGHGGGTNGQITLLTLVPDAGFAVAVFTNHSRGGEITREVTRVALREYLDLDEREPETRRLTREELAEYAGRYTSALADVELEPGEGVLVQRTTPKGGFPKRDSPPPPAPPPFELAFYGADLVVVPEGRFRTVRAQFLRGPDGRVAWLRQGGRVHRREGT